MTYENIRRGEPGLRRQVLIDPRPGYVRGDLADDFHHFTVELFHDGTRIERVRSTAHRYPRTLCAQAPAYFESRLTGSTLADVGSFDDPLQHCTHQVDLATLLAAHAGESAPVLFSAYVADTDDAGMKHAEIHRNGQVLLDWDIVADTIRAPSPQAGLNLRRLRDWIGDLTRDEQEGARILRRTIFISYVRLIDTDTIELGQEPRAKPGACYVYQSERLALKPPKMDNRRDFSMGDAMPLSDRLGELGI